MRFPLFLALLMIIGFPTFVSADGDKPKPEPPVCERPDLCPDLDKLISSEVFEGLSCKHKRKACKAGAALEFKCEKSIAQAVLRSAREQCETRECAKEVRAAYKATFTALRDSRKAKRATCKAVCGAK